MRKSHLKTFEREQCVENEEGGTGYVAHSGIFGNSI